jgi:hypothetical protein
MKFKKTHIFILVMSFFFNIQGFGQSFEYPFLCGHNEVIRINEVNYPGYKTNVTSTFDLAYKMKDEVTGAREEIFTIPVVVHLVWKNNEENLDDSLIYSQIDVLNEAFRLRNKNKDEIRDIFKDVQADAGIEFELKEIKRVKTNANFALSLTGLPDRVKQSGNGGSNASATEYFLNIWVCKIQPIPFIGGQILGYAYPPSGLAHWPAGTAAPSKDLEGVVIDFRVFGKNNPNQLTVNGLTHDAQGLTTVHEVGHYLGLRHIWGDGGGLLGGNSCGEDDGMSDTPNQGTQSPGGCNKSANTCTDTMNDLPDMVENYMDYSGEKCQNTFTKEQVAMMRSVLKNQRKLLTTSSHTVLNNKIKIWPNPFYTNLQIMMDENRAVDATLKNLEGKILMSKNIETNERLDLSHLSQGIYFLTMIDGQQHHTVKLIKLNE